MRDIHNLTLSDFLQMEIRRTPGQAYINDSTGFGWEDEAPALVAEIIFDHDESGRPVRLMGFVTDGGKSDFEIAEDAIAFWRRLYEYLSKD